MTTNAATRYGNSVTLNLGQLCKLTLIGKRASGKLRSGWKDDAKTPDNNTLHTEPRAARLFLLASLSPRPGERCRYHACHMSNNIPNFDEAVAEAIAKRDADELELALNQDIQPDGARTAILESLLTETWHHSHEDILRYLQRHPSPTSVKSIGVATVSYTHLTLPTICSV